MRAVIATLATVLCSCAAFAEGYVANTYGVEGRYRVFEFTANGHPVRPVSGLSHSNVAWPSAVRIGNRVHVFASVQVGGKWSEIRRWTSVDGAAYVDDGAVFVAGVAEPHGVGPATVTYDGSVFRIYYLERGISGPGSAIGVARSGDGLSFVRAGTVYTAASSDGGGLSVSYACIDGGMTYLLLHSYSTDLSTASSVIASAQDPDGVFSRGGELLAKSDMHGTVTGQAGNSFAQFSGSLTEGRPIVVRDGNATSYIVKEIKGATVYFDRPLAQTYASAPFADFMRNKADISFVSKLEDKWIGAVTGYGQFPGLTSEYTSRLSAPEVSGPWVVDGGYFLSPYFNSGRYSTENPEPIRSSASCVPD